MKVLWFSNTPALGEEQVNLKVTGGGWIKALDQALQDVVDLHIAFHYPKASAPFKSGSSHYYPVTVKNWKLRLIRDNLTNRVYDREFLEHYLNLINEIRPDIIHIHGTESPFGCLIGKTDIPVVLSIQGNINVYTHKYTSGLGSGYLKINKFDISQGLASFLFAKNFSSGYDKFKKMARIEARNLSDCQFVIGRTEWDKRITSVLAPRAKYFHGDELLRDGFYSSAWSKKRTSDLIIHSTSGNSYFKGFETICQSLNELNKLGISVTWQVAGIQDSDLIVKIVRKKLGRDFPSKGLILPGSLSETELIDRMLQADIFVGASHIENSPNSLCEAMMLGMPCIVTFAGGTGSLLKDREEGILIQDGDPWVMAGAVLELANDPGKGIKLGEKARLTALQRHNKERIVKELINTYTEII